MPNFQPNYPYCLEPAIGPEYSRRIEGPLIYPEHVENPEQHRRACPVKSEGHSIGAKPIQIE